MEEVKKIWLDGRFLDWKEAKIHILTHSLHYGGAVFEGIRAYKTKEGTAVFRLLEHLDRFFQSAQILEMEIPFSKEEIKKVILETIKINNLKECYIRPIAFSGYGKMGLNPKGAAINVAIAAWPWGAYLGDKETVKIEISDYIRPHPQSCPMEAKISGYYINSIFASLEAQKKGFDEALLLDYQGYVAEGPGENVFMVKDNILYTPLAGTILPGITRASVIEIAKDLGIFVKEKKITPQEIKEANEAFFTGTAVEICPIGQIDEVLINKGQIGKITKKIKEVFEKIVKGEEKKYLKWLTFV